MRIAEQQPAAAQDFLLKTSILDREDSRELVLGLEQANLFIVPLDESRQWYCYHRLFAKLLRQQLRTVGMKSLAPDLHQRASRWYEAAGFADAVSARKPFEIPQRPPSTNAWRR